MELDKLWAQIEMAGPLSRAESLSHPPPGVDLDEWSERALTQADRRRTFIALYAWAVPSREAIAGIRDFVAGRQLLEVCAGGGLWATLLLAEGIAVVATDAVPAEGTEFVRVEALEAEAAVRAHRECEALLLCWPPFRNDCAVRALQAFLGDRLIYVGDMRFTGDERLHRLLQQTWKRCERLPLPSWPGLEDYTHLYTRRGVGSMELADVLDIRDFSNETLLTLAERLESSRTFQELILREVELDEIYRRVDSAAKEAETGEAGGVDAGTLQQIRPLVFEAHDLASAGQPLEAARSLRAAMSLEPRA